MDAILLLLDEISTKQEALSEIMLQLHWTAYSVGPFWGPKHLMTLIWHVVEKEICLKTL